LKQGVVQPSRSKFNNLIYVVAKPDGGLRIVHDFNGNQSRNLAGAIFNEESIGQHGRSKQSRAQVIFENRLNFQILADVLETRMQEVHGVHTTTTFFRAHVRNFAQLTAPLTELTKRECLWKTGPLLEPADKAYRELKTILI
jgi:hypothetical protein